MTIDDATVARLITEQFPGLSPLPLGFFASGWDNTTYRRNSLFGRTQQWKRTK